MLKLQKTNQPIRRRKYHHMISSRFQEAFSSQWLKTHVPDPTNELAIWRKIIPWQRIIEKLTRFYHHDKGRLGNSLRMMVALVLLTTLRELSDREGVKQSKENRYFQFFCNR